MLPIIVILAPQWWSDMKQQEALEFPPIFAFCSLLLFS